MIPRIFEVTEDQRLKISAECFVIPELYAIIDEYEMNAEPYLMHVYYHTAPDSIYINYDFRQKDEVIISDITQRYGEYNYDSPLVKTAIERLKEIYNTRTQRLYVAGGISIDRMCTFLSETEIEQGKEGNLAEIDRIQNNMGKKMREYKDLEKLRDDEIKESMRGSGEMGYE